MSTFKLSGRGGIINWHVSKNISFHFEKHPRYELGNTDIDDIIETISHSVESCPLTKLNGNLSRLHSGDEDAVSWLTSYG